MKRYEVTIENETFMIGTDYDGYHVFTVTDHGLTQSEEYYTNNTQRLINNIFDNIEDYLQSENQITNPNFDTEQGREKNGLPQTYTV